MDTDKFTINRICNSLNAQSGFSRHRYLNNEDKRELDISNIMDEAQILIRTLETTRGFRTQNHPIDDIRNL